MWLSMCDRVSCLRLCELCRHPRCMPSSSGVERCGRLRHWVSTESFGPPRGNPWCDHNTISALLANCSLTVAVTEARCLEYQQSRRSSSPVHFFTTDVRV
ncbi:hypothetical protein CSUI_004254 [Cystoisospora suis]|uniref:Uncharacterized protein n=1 Tax=Cystoisospora suis TaxID=483139 RepID=A0A2C6KZF0_9APIC|nr:hypothetical protein CSUI_004254 [Cystoisospora suis]